jgi:hypothetical protein
MRLRACDHTFHTETDGAISGERQRCRLKTSFQSRPSASPMRAAPLRGILVCSHLLSYCASGSAGPAERSTCILRQPRLFALHVWPALSSLRSIGPNLPIMRSRIGIYRNLVTLDRVRRWPLLQYRSRRANTIL